MNIHILPDGDQWVVLQQGKTGEQRYLSKAEAVQAGHELAKQTGGEVLVHDQRGRIEPQPEEESETPTARPS